MCIINIQFGWLGPDRGCALVQVRRRHWMLFGSSTLSIFFGSSTLSISFGGRRSFAAAAAEPAACLFFAQQAFFQHLRCPVARSRRRRRRRRAVAWCRAAVEGAVAGDCAEAGVDGRTSVSQIFFPHLSVLPVCSRPPLYALSGDSFLPYRHPLAGTCPWPSASSRWPPPPGLPGFNALLTSEELALCGLSALTTPSSTAHPSSVALCTPPAPAATDSVSTDWSSPSVPSHRNHCPSTALRSR